MLSVLFMMEENDETLSKISEFAGLFFTAEEISILMKIDLNDLKKKLRNKNSKTHKAYMLGKLNTMVKIRTNLISMAKNGSPGAEQQILSLKRDQDISEKDF